MNYEHLTLERLEEMLDYSENTGTFIWKKRPFEKSKRRAGDVAGTSRLKPNGKHYRTIGIDGRMYQASQLAYFYANKRWPAGQVGLKDGDSSNLRADNLVEMRTTDGKHDLKTKEGRARYQGDYWARNMDYRRELGFKRYYGLSFSDYTKLSEAQGNVCAMCRKPETSKQGETLRCLAVDHCHESNKVRGLLCNRCNVGLGYFGENPDLIERAMEYLLTATTEHTIPLKRTA